VTDSTDPHPRRALTPAVTAAAAFALVAAVVSVAFVSARGGLQLPVAATATPGTALAPTGPGDSPGPPTAGPPDVSPAAVPTAAPASAPPTAPPPSAVPPTPAPSRPADPLLGLPTCPGHPGCFEYTVRRGDSLSAVSDRYSLLLWITRALNPEVTGASVIVVGQTLYLGHDPMARLDACPDAAPCHLYVVRSGDTLSTIAGRYGLSLTAILAINPGVDASLIITGQVLRLPLFGG
jgi:nucleoid-associated protein YgaU